MLIVRRALLAILAAASPLHACGGDLGTGPVAVAELHGMAAPDGATRTGVDDTVAVGEIEVAVRLFGPVREGTVVVASGVPLVPGALRPGDLRRVRLFLDGTERAISVTPLAGLHRDGSLRSVLVRFPLAVDARRVPSGRITLTDPRPETHDWRPESAPASTRDSRRRHDGPRGEAVAALLPLDPDYLVRTELVGPTRPSSYVRLFQGPFARYESDFVKYADRHWRARGDAWGENYYDRALIYYAWWVRTGNPEYWHRGTRLAVSYRRDYLEKNSYGSSPHWAQLEGLEKHYLLTGDEQSRYAIARVARAFNYYVTRLDRVNLSNFESRIQARVLQAHLLAWRLDARGDEPRDWNALLPSLLDQILSTQQPDGSYRFAFTCHESLNYMTGMLNDVLVSYHDYYRADARIPVAVRKSVDWLWQTQWVPEARAFRYVSAPCEGVGQGGPTPDLNLMFVTGPAWLYRQTGDARYRDIADQIFAGGVGRGNLTGTKQFNENYYASFKYLGYR